MKIKIIINIILLLSIASCVPQANWETYESSEGAFSVLVQGMPELDNTEIDIIFGSVTLYMYIWDKTDIVYMIAFADYPDEVVSYSNPEDMLDAAKEGALENVQGEIISEKNIELKGYPGKEIVISAKVEEAIATVHLYMVRNRLYQVLVITTENDPQRDNVSKFLDSFDVQY